MKGPNPEELMTVPEVATMFKVKPATVRTWIRQDKLIAIRLGDKHSRLRIKGESVIKLANKMYGDNT